MNYKRLSSISFGHLAIDVLNSSLAMVLTSVAGVFALSDGQIGLGALIYTLVGSLTQPIFGALADKLQGRWLGPLGLLWTMIFYALIPFAPNYPTLITILAVGALGSAALHAVGMLVASDAGNDRPTTATSVFFLMGQSGLALGPLLAGLVLQEMGLNGLPLLAVIALVAVVMMFAYLRGPVRYDESPAAAASESGNGRAIRWGVIGAFVLLILLRSITLHTYMIFLPRFLEGRGFSPAAYGVMVSTFVFGGAIGTFLGGYLGDRFNRRMVIFLSSIIGVPFCYIMLGASGPLFFMTAALAGGLLNIAHSILIVMAQALLPQQKGMMGGLTLGFMFASGASMAALAGAAADVVGLSNVMYALAFMPIPAGLSALLLPSTRKKAAPVRVASATAGD